MTSAVFSATTLGWWARSLRSFLLISLQQEIYLFWSCSISSCTLTQPIDRHTHTHTTHSQDTDPTMFKADFVLVFDTSLREQEIMPQEYLQLVNSLKEAGLVVTARSGVKDSNTILVLVRATNGRLLREIEAQARLDFVKGVHSPRANMQLETAADRPVPLTPAERLYYVDQIITTSQDKSTEAIKYAGVSVGSQSLFLTQLEYPVLVADLSATFTHPVSDKPFPRVKDIFAPHDTQFNNEWLPSWSKDMSLMDLKLKELDQVAA